MNMQLPNQEKVDDVVYLKDTKKTETASSANTVNTVICLDKLNVNNIKIPEVMITKDSIDKGIFENGTLKKRATRSKSPSTKSQSTLSTVQENHLSFKSGDSPLQSSRGKIYRLHIYPNWKYPILANKAIFKCQLYKYNDNTEFG